jgi:quinol monooxygenase YgiN
MRRVIVRYRVKDDRIEENVALVRAVYEELHRERPDGLRYATVQVADDPAAFVHIAEHVEGTNHLNSTAAFQAFQAGLGERCAEPPVLTELNTVGSYGLFGTES